MSRRTSIFEDVMKLPWPVGVGMALLCLLALQAYLWLIPEPTTGFGVGKVVPPIVQWFAYGCAALFMLAAVFSFLTQVMRGKRFKATRSIADIRSLSWQQFEWFIGELFRQRGYFVVETPEGPDNGVDLVLRKDGEKTYVQCKHWKTNRVGVEKVRELLGSMAAGGAARGIFVTSGSYTQPACDLARECGIELLDGDTLARNLDLDSPPLKEPSEVLAPPSCPHCSATMVKRTASRGENHGKAFWGCSNYPRCKGTRGA